jgi:hypothetical protein
LAHRNRRRAHTATATRLGRAARPARTSTSVAPAGSSDTVRAARIASGVVGRRRRAGWSGATAASSK